MKSVEHPIIFYDGECGLCHYWVQQTLRNDAKGIFRFAAQQSQLFEQLGTANRNTILVLLPDGTLLSKGKAILYILEQTRGEKSVAFRILRRCPQFILDAGYTFVAGIRRWLFPKPAQLCPIVPAEWQCRFIS